jgi:hypothetical protein
MKKIKKMRRREVTKLQEFFGKVKEIKEKEKEVKVKERNKEAMEEEGKGRIIPLPSLLSLL